MLSDPSPHIVIGLSNLSQGASERPLINRTFLVMAIAAGLDACFHDPLDQGLMEEMIAAEMLLNKSIYSDSFLKAYLQSR
jgi:5-methyltetrahydrofolate corrinoid/iron sulfur protein methyltransferase